MDHFDAVKERSTQLYEGEAAVTAGHGGEYALLLALLFDGLDAYTSSFQTENDSERKLFEEVSEWVYGEDIDYLFSFASSCQTLGVDADKLRLGLLNVSFSRSYVWKRVCQNDLV